MEQSTYVFDYSLGSLSDEMFPQFSTTLYHFHNLRATSDESNFSFKLVCSPSLILKYCRKFLLWFWQILNDKVESWP